MCARLEFWILLQPRRVAVIVNVFRGTSYVGVETGIQQGRAPQPSGTCYLESWGNSYIKSVRQNSYIKRGHA